MPAEFMPAFMRPLTRPSRSERLAPNDCHATLRQAGPDRSGEITPDFTRGTDRLSSAQLAARNARPSGEWMSVFEAGGNAVIDRASASAPAPKMQLRKADMTYAARDRCLGGSLKFIPLKSYRPPSLGETTTEDAACGLSGGQTAEGTVSSRGRLQKLFQREKAAWILGA